MKKKAIIKDLVDIMEKDVSHSSSYNEMFFIGAEEDEISSNYKIELKSENENEESMKLSKKKHKMNFMKLVKGIFENEKKAIIKDLIDNVEKDLSHSSSYDEMLSGN